MARYNKRWDDLTEDEKMDRDLIGRRFGTMTVLNFEGTQNGYDKWLVQCLCGSRKVKDGRNLRSGGTKTCGRDCDFYRRGR